MMTSEKNDKRRDEVLALRRYSSLQFNHSAQEASPDQVDYYIDLRVAAEDAKSLPESDKPKARLLPSDNDIDGILHERGTLPPGTPIKERIKHDADLLDALANYTQQEGFRLLRSALDITQHLANKRISELDKEADENYREIAPSERILNNNGNVTEVDFAS